MASGMGIRSLRALAVCLGGSAAAGVIGAVGARDAPQVYARLEKPRWAPPASVFGPVWSALYVSMGIAAWRVWRSGHGRVPLALHGTQLALNAAWPAVFFTARARREALAVICALDAVLAAEIVTAARTDRPASALLVPYLAWSLYATALTAAVRDPAARRGH